MDGWKGPPTAPKAGTLAIVWWEARVLLVKRRYPPHSGHWGFPGGRIGLGEPLRNAAQRELMEETGITAQAGEPLTALDLIDQDAEGDLHWHFVLIAVRLHYCAGQALPGDDALETGWFFPNALPEPLCPHVASLIRASRPTPS